MSIQDDDVNSNVLHSNSSDESFNERIEELMDQTTVHLRRGTEALKSARVALNTVRETPTFSDPTDISLETSGVVSHSGLFIPKASYSLGDLLRQKLNERGSATSTIVGDNSIDSEKATSVADHQTKNVVELISEALRSHHEEIPSFMHTSTEDFDSSSKTGSSVYEEVIMVDHERLADKFLSDHYRPVTVNGIPDVAVHTKKVFDPEKPVKVLMTLENWNFAEPVYIDCFVLESRTVKDVSFYLIQNQKETFLGFARLPGICELSDKSIELICDRIEQIEGFSVPQIKAVKTRLGFKPIEGVDAVMYWADSFRKKVRKVKQEQKAEELKVAALTKTGRFFYKTGRLFQRG